MGDIGLRTPGVGLVHRGPGGVHGTWSAKGRWRHLVYGCLLPFFFIYVGGGCRDLVIDNLLFSMLVGNAGKTGTFAVRIGCKMRRMFGGETRIGPVE